MMEEFNYLDINEHNIENITHAILNDQPEGILYYGFKNKSGIAKEQLNNFYEAIKKSKLITGLRIKDPHFELAQLELITDVIKNSNQISTIKFESSPLTEEELVPILDVIRFTDTIKELSFIENKNLASQGLNFICDIIETSPNITSLCFSGCMLDKTSINRIANSIKNHKSIKSIEVSNNPVDSVAFLTLVAAIQENSTLEYVTLNYMGATSLAAEAIAKLLSTKINLHELSLIGNDFSGGVNKIFNALKDNHYCNSIFLDASEVSHSDLFSLSKMIEYNKSLSTLAFNFPEISLEDRKNLIASIQKNNVLTYMASTFAGRQTFSNTYLLRTAVQEFLNGMPLDDNKINILAAHLYSRSNTSLERFPDELKEKFKLFYKNLMEKTKNSMKQYSGLMPEINNKIIDYTDYESKINLYKADIQYKYIVNLGLNQQEQIQLDEMFNIARKFGCEDYLYLPSNVTLVNEGFKQGVQFDEINSNLSSLLSDKTSKEIIDGNPKILGYLITLKTQELENIVTKFNSNEFSRFLVNNPSQANNFLNIINDETKLAMLANELQENPRLDSIDHLVQKKEGKFVKKYLKSKDKVNYIDR
jgi:hypothetical protein